MCLLIVYLGASTPPGIPVTVEPKSIDPTRLEQLEMEKEQLSASLFALTTRFAQVMLWILAIKFLTQAKCLIKKVKRLFLYLISSK